MLSITKNTAINTGKNALVMKLIESADECMKLQNTLSKRDLRMYTPRSKEGFNFF